MIEIEDFNFDAVIILSQSDWFSEMRSNRYNYATRLSKLAPVYFVQKYDPLATTSLIARTEENITIVNPIEGYTEDTLELILNLTRKHTVQNILFWIYTPEYAEILPRLSVPNVAVYHATEAYINSGLMGNTPGKHRNIYLEKLKATINVCDCVIAVSEGVADGIRADPEIASPVFTITNGCDYKFWYGLDKNERSETVLYQGGIHRKLDFELIHYIVSSNPEINFIFCGEDSIEMEADLDIWNKILKFPNFKFMGRVHPDKVRGMSHTAKVGIIPFRADDWLKDMSFPLKAFEYLASGMEVVSTPINALSPFADHFHIAEYKERFNDSIHIALKNSRRNSTEREEVCKAQDYDVKFRAAASLIAELPKTTPVWRKAKKKVALLYDKNSCKLSEVREHVNAFGLFSRHNITYVNPVGEVWTTMDFLKSFNAIVVHYSVSRLRPDQLTTDVQDALSRFNGLKILLIQDDYGNRTPINQYLIKINFDAVFTCVAETFQRHALSELHSYEYFIQTTIDKVIDENVLYVRSEIIFPTGSFLAIKERRFKSFVLKYARRRRKGFVPSTILSEDAEFITDSQDKPALQTSFNLIGLMLINIVALMPKGVINTVLNCYRFFRYRFLRGA